MTMVRVLLITMARVSLITMTRVLLITLARVLLRKTAIVSLVNHIKFTLHLLYFVITAAMFSFT